MVIGGIDLSRKLRVGIDLDGVMVDSPQQVVHYINRHLGTSFTINDFKSYRMEDALQDQYKWIVGMAFKDPEMWKNVSLIEGAYENVKKLYEEEYEIYFVTSSLPQNLKKKIGHLSRNLDFFPKDFVWKHTINTQNKQIIDLDIMVDDALFNLTGERPYYSLCMDMPYNQTRETIPNFTRVKNWNDIYVAIHLIETLIKENEE